MLTVKVLGMGCPNCQRLEAITRAALDSAQPEITYELIKVTDYMDIIAYGLLATPALVINDRLVAAGRIPTPGQIVHWAREAQNDSIGQK